MISLAVVLLGVCAVARGAQGEGPAAPDPQDEALARMAGIAAAFKVASANRTLEAGHTSTIVERVVLDVYAPVPGARPSSFYYGIPYLQVASLGFYEARGASKMDRYACELEKIGDYTFVRVDLPSSFDLVDLDRYNAGERSTPLKLELHYSGYARYKSKFSGIFSSSSPASYSSGPNRDRLLTARLCAEALLPYQCKVQSTTISFERDMYKFHDNDPAVEVGPYDKSSATVTAGPYYDNEPGFCTRVDIDYYSSRPSLQLEAERSVYVKGIQLYSHAEHPEAGPVRIVDSFRVLNTDPKPGSGRYSRATASRLAANHRVDPLPSTLLVSLPPGARNIKVFDRIGQIQSWDATEAATATILSVHPRHDLAGQDKGAFSVSYDVDLVRSAQSLQSGQGEQGEQNRGRLLRVPFGATVEDSFYKSASLCVYLPETASDVEVHAPIPGLHSREVEQESGVLIAAPRKGVCVEHGVSSHALVGKEVVVSWRAEDATLTGRKLAYLAGLIASMLGVITLGRVLL